MKGILLFLLIAPGLGFAYAYIARPLLHKIPALQQFYNDADGFWAKTWALAGNEFKLAFGYLMGGLGTALAMIDPIASLLGDPQFSDQIKAWLAARPEWLGYFSLLVSVITIAARLRAISKS